MPSNAASMKEAVKADDVATDRHLIEQDIDLDA